MAALIPRPAPGVGGWGFQLTSALVEKAGKECDDDNTDSAA